jgi:hypothetical protein
MDTKLRLIDAENHHRHHWHGRKAQINRNKKIIIGIIGRDTKLRLIETIKLS